MKTLFLSLPLVVLLLTACGDGGSHKWVDNKIIAGYQEDTIAEPAAAGCPSTAEIHIDASGSMKPYFGADVAGDLINTISCIHNLNTAGTALFWQDYPQPLSKKVKISTIITDVKHQPSTIASVFYDFFGKQAAKVDTTNTLVYLVTDGIMSEGDGRGGFGNMNLSLEQLKGRVTASLQGHKNLAAAILRYEGGYHGDYWNQNNQRITAKQCPLLKDAITRPYYVIVLGRKDAVRWLLTLPAEKLNNPKGQLFMGVHDLAGHGKATLSCPDGVEPGEMSLEHPVDPITLVLDLPSCLKDIDATQVLVRNGSKDLNVKVEKTVAARGSATLTAVVPETIPITPNAEGVCTISFVAENSIPSVWLDAWDCADDSAGPDLSSTFSLRYLVQGMWTALEGDTPLLHCDFIYNINN